MDINLKNIIEKIENKQNRYFFYIPKSQNNITAGIQYVFDMAYQVQEHGHKAILFNEHDDYEYPNIEEKYKTIEFIPISKLANNEDYKIDMADFFFIGELYVEGLVKQMRKTNLPAKIVVISQAYDYIFHHMEIGSKWDLTYRLTSCLTTTEQQKDFIQQFMPLTMTKVVKPFIPDFFEKDDLPHKPYVAIMSRFPSDGEKLIKMFFAKYPHLSWIPFKAIGGMSRKDFANELKQCMLGVWLDEPSSFGTFPLECMKCEVPCMGLIPTMVPEWMVENEKLARNGFWTASKLIMVDMLATTIDNILHNSDEIDEIVKNGKQTADRYDEKTYIESMGEYIKTLKSERIEQLKKIQTNEKGQ